MTRKKRDLFRELSAGIRAMRDHAEGRVELRTTRVNPSRTELEGADTRPSVLPGDVVKTTTRAPNALASFTAMCPSPPRPTTPTFCPLRTFQCRRGE